MALLSGAMWTHVLENREACCPVGAGFWVPKAPVAGNGIGMVTPQSHTALHNVQKALPYKPEFGLICSS